MKPTTDLYDDYEGQVATCALQFRDFGGRTQFFGPIRTVRCDRDNQLFRALLDEPGNGAVVVVDGGGSTATALMGDIIAAKGAKNGWAGVVINGAIRDSAEIGRIDFGAKALGVQSGQEQQGRYGRYRRRRRVRRHNVSRRRVDLLRRRRRPCLAG